MARLAGLLLGAAATMVASSAWADACNSKNWNGAGSSSIPDCELQVQSSLSFSALDTKAWAFHCSGDHPYFWGLLYGYSPSYTFNNNCFTIPENAAAEEGDNTKFDATFTNWCLKKESVTVTLACSDTPP
jgi:hypothetical protein